MPTSWTDATDRQLLLYIIHLTAPKPDWVKVADMMGPNFTAESTRQHFAKMKKDCVKMFGEPEDVPDGKTAKATPRKAKANKENGETPNVKVGGKRKGNGNDDDGEEDEADTSPKKKKGTKAVKQEEQAADDSS